MIPEFLRLLMDNKIYDAIIMITQFEILKEKSDMSITIKRENKISQLQYGNIQRRLRIPGRRKKQKNKTKTSNPLIHHQKNISKNYKNN